MGYCWACQQLGYSVNTAAVNGIALLKRDYKFQRALVQFPQHLLDRWYKQLLSDIREIVAAYKSITRWQNPVSRWEQSDDAFPYNFADACSSYGGCAFIPLCSAKEPQNYFTNYTKFIWDPLAKQSVKELENA
jgi:hypothetical protein